MSKETPKQSYSYINWLQRMKEKKEKEEKEEKVETEKLRQDYLKRTGRSEMKP